MAPEEHANLGESWSLRDCLPNLRTCEYIGFKQTTPFISVSEYYGLEFPMPDLTIIAKVVGHGEEQDDTTRARSANI